MSKKNAQLKEIPIEFLRRGHYQTRQIFDPAALDELAASIVQQGLIEPIVVRPIDATYYEIIAGERRWRAAAIAGLSEVTCLVRNYTDDQAAAVTVIENVQREDLNAIEEAHGYKKLIDEFFFYHDDIAKIVGKSRVFITNSLRLLELNEQVQVLIKEKQLSSGHAKTLVGLSPHLQLELAHKIIKNSWSVRKIEAEVKQLKSSTIHRDPKKDRDIVRLEQLITEQCGTTAQIEADHNNGGWLKIKFYDNDTLAGILEKMGVRV